MNSIGVQLGQALGNAATAAESFLKANWKGLTTELEAIAKLAIQIGASFAEMTEDAVAMVALTGSGSQTAKAAIRRDRENNDIDHHYDWEMSKVNAKDYVLDKNDPVEQAQFAKRRQQLKADRDQARARVQDEFSKNSGQQAASDTLHSWGASIKAIDQAAKAASASIDSLGKSTIAATKNNSESDFAPEHPTHGISSKSTGSSNALREDQKGLQDEITKTQTKYQDLGNSIKDSVTKGTLSHRQAATQIAALNERELSDITKLIRAYQAKSRLLQPWSTAISARVTCTSLP